MIELDKKHNPVNNSKMIVELLREKQDIRTTLEETDRLFRLNPINHTAPNHKSKFLKGSYKFPIAAKARLSPELPAAIVDDEGNVFPQWMKKLDEQYHRMLGKIKRQVNIEDFGAVGDGKIDNTEAFKKAFGNGRVKVIVPEGIFIVKEIKLPSWTCLMGKGKGKTILKLDNDAPVSTRLVTNANHWRGNHHIYIGGMTLDWNVERLGNIEKTSTWGNHSSCLALAHVTFGWVKDVEAINPGLHCFDVTSTLYNYSGDGYRARRGSRYVWLDYLNGFGFGDDGITTHHSDFVFISNCHMCDPSGKAHEKGNSNSNGIEIDDGSQNIFLANNSTSRCFGGVEIKAHENSSAASNIQIVGHLSVNDNRSYNFRHIGHHKYSDQESKTAYNIKATNIVAIAPIYSDLYSESHPRGLVVSAYKNVVINNFLLIGNPEYDYKDNHPIIAIQYRARNVVLNQITVQNFKKAGVDIKIFGGKQRADHVTITNSLIKESAKQAINIGEGIRNIKLKNIQAFRDGGVIGLKSDSPYLNISGFEANGYKTPVVILKKTSS